MTQSLLSHEFYIVLGEYSVQNQPCILFNVIGNAHDAQRAHPKWGCVAFQQPILTFLHGRLRGAISPFESFGPWDCSGYKCSEAGLDVQKHLRTFLKETFSQSIC